MRRFFCRLPVYALLLAELIALVPILTMSMHLLHIKDDETGKIVDDGQVHEVGLMPLPHTVEPSLVDEDPETDEPGDEAGPEDDSDPALEDEDSGAEDPDIAADPGTDVPGDETDPAVTDDPDGEADPNGETDPDGEADPDGSAETGGETDPDDGSDPNADPGSDGEAGEEEPPLQIIPGGLPETERVDPSYFDDAVFIGDSVSLKLLYYVREQRKSDENYLGKAQFLTAGSFSYINALRPVSEESVHPSYQGTKMLLENAIFACGAKKLYIMLGMNDIAGGRYEGTLQDLDTLIARILEKTPDVTFYFQSVTPRMADSQTRKLNNEVIRTYNQKLLQHCEENGYYFVDIYAALCDENGDLPASYCSDPVSTGGMGIHFTNAACSAWVDYLYTHTA